MLHYRQMSKLQCQLLWHSAGIIMLVHVCMCWRRKRGEYAPIKPSWPSVWTEPVPGMRTAQEKHARQPTSLPVRLPVLLNAASQKHHLITLDNEKTSYYISPCPSSPADSAFLVKAEQGILTSKLPDITAQGTSHLLHLTLLLLNCVDLVSHHYFCLGR